jgi:predicted TIM-barrel fold metal-dependent hydrolase
MGLIITPDVLEGGASIVDKTGGDDVPGPKGAWLVVSPMQLDEVLTSMVFSGIPECHPHLKMVLGEGGIGWLPYVLEHMDYTYEDGLTDHITLSLKPSENFQQRIYATFQKDAIGIRMIGEIAPDNVMWASD